MSRSLLLAAALAAATPAAAQLQQSPRWGSMDLGVQAYRPNIDAEFGGAHSPYADLFGTGNGWMFTLGISRAIFTSWGSLETGIRTGYFSKSGNSLVTDAGGTSPAGAKTSLKFVPTSLALTYRFDWAVERYRIPLAPYGRLALERYNWWITKGAGGTAEKGATNGWSATGGLAFLLDFLDPDLAREFDRDSGVNHTYVFFEVTKARVDDFGSSKSWDMGTKDLAYSAGMTFVF